MKDKIARQFHNRNLKSKMLLIIIPCAIISSITIMILAWWIFNQYESTLYNSTMQNLNMIVRYMEMDLNKIENLSDRIITEDTVQTTLQYKEPNIRKKEVSSEYILAARNLYQLMQDRLAAADNVRSISIFVDNEWYYVGASKRSYSKEIIEAAGAELEESNGEIIWYSDKYPANYLYSIRKIKEIGKSSYRDMGVLVIEYNIRTSINKLITESDGIKYEPKVVIWNSKGMIFSSIDDIQTVEWKDNVDYEILSLGKHKYFTSYLQSPVYHWNYMFLISYDTMLGIIHGLRITFAFLFILVSIVSSYYCDKLISKITIRINYLLTRMKSVEKGDLSSKEYIDTGNDEIGMLCRHFEIMVEKLDILIQDNYVKQMLIRENQLKVLQSQINPHFLFNTLQTINWKAKNAQEKDISLIAESLGKLLRYTLRDDNDPVILSEEIKVLENYIAIQQFRYEKRLQVVIDIPETLYSQKIPKLALQNVVENSIKYALENMMEPCKIRIWGEDQGNTFKLYVLDNGPGLKEENMTVTNHPEIKNEITSAGLGIGLKNVDRRMKLIFSDEYGIKIKDTGHGVMVQFYMPKE